MRVTGTGNLLACLFGLALLPAAASAATLDRHGNSLIGPVYRDEALSFRIYLPPRDKSGLAGFVEHVSKPGDPLYHQFLTPDAVTARFGPTAQDLATLRAAAGAAGLSVIGGDARSVEVSGWSETVQSFIGTSLQHVVTADGKPLIAAKSQIHLPSRLTALGAEIFAFRGAIHMHSPRNNSRPLAHPFEAGSGTGPFLTSDLKQAYDAPSYQSLSGTGATIAIMIDGSIANSDLQAYFRKLGVAQPGFSVVTIDGGSSTASFEGTLDVTQAGGFAPGAAIIQYQMPDLSDQSIVDALSQIISDNDADVVSMSFGACELDYLAYWDGPFSDIDTLLYEDYLYQEGVAAGITFAAAAGDNGALACAPAGYGNTPYNAGISGSFQPGVQTPASSPNITAVGGTNLTVSTGSNSTYVAENADDDAVSPETADDGTASLAGAVWGSGGGASLVFPQPSYQLLVTTGVATRALPDLAMHMGGCPPTATGTCPADRSDDYLVFQGQETGAIGTSAATPDFAGVVALMVQHAGRQGRVNDAAYTLAQKQTKGTGAAAFRRNIPGNNGLYTSSSGQAYSLVVGNGSLDIRQFMGVTNLPDAGAPGSASNP